MIDFSQSELSKVIAHSVGNKLRDEGVQLSNLMLEFASDESKTIFLRYIFSSFRENELLSFSHSAELELNEMYSYATKIFENPKTFEKQSRNIAQHLYNESIHPKVNSGELYIVYLVDCIIDDEMVNAIGVFKSENKDVYLKPKKIESGFLIDSDKGVNISKLDKGCLIFDTDKETGYKICSIDNSNKNEDAQYWKDRFLKVVPRNDDYHFTKNFLSLTKAFVTKELNQEFDISPTDKAEYLNRSLQYFTNNEQLNQKHFANEVFEDPALIKSFQKFKDNYEERTGIDLSNEFHVSTQAVKKHAKYLKSMLRLDKNFHIYIHGDIELIERGVEKDGRKYYKIYYENES